MANRCGDCNYLDYKDVKWDGEKIWCNYRREYTRPSDIACRYYSYNNHNYGTQSSCYLTTAVVDILGYDDHCCYLDELREFRDAIMKKEVDCYDLLYEYKTLGPKIANCLYIDPDRERMSTMLLDHCIKPAIEEITNGQYEQAIDTYIGMTNGLLNYYEIDTNEKPLERIRKDRD